jgi:Ni,Fe-hydrogenase I large subunit
MDGRHHLALAEQPLEVLRTIHSFDPCMACAAHVFDAAGAEVARVKIR